MDSSHSPALSDPIQFFLYIQFIKVDTDYFSYKIQFLEIISYTSAI